MAAARIGAMVLAAAALTVGATVSVRSESSRGDPTAAEGRVWLECRGSDHLELRAPRAIPAGATLTWQIHGGRRIMRPGDAEPAVRRARSGSRVLTRPQAAGVWFTVSEGQVIGACAALARWSDRPLPPEGPLIIG